MDLGHAASWRDVKLGICGDESGRFEDEDEAKNCGGMGVFVVGEGRVETLGFLGIMRALPARTRPRE